MTGLDAAMLEKILLEIEPGTTRTCAPGCNAGIASCAQPGWKNREIFPRLQEESRRTLVRPGPLSVRQIRRALYG